MLSNTLPLVSLVWTLNESPYKQTSYYIFYNEIVPYVGINTARKLQDIP